jgi:hypothetical protein
VSGFKSLLELIQDLAERELYDEERIREDLLLLQVRLSEGELTEEEYVAQEAEIMIRLRAAREYRKARAARETDQSAALYEIEGHVRER